MCRVTELCSLAQGTAQERAKGARCRAVKSQELCSLGAGRTPAPGEQVKVKDVEGKPPTLLRSPLGVRGEMSPRGQQQLISASGVKRCPSAKDALSVLPLDPVPLPPKTKSRCRNLHRLQNQVLLVRH